MVWGGEAWRRRWAQSHADRSSRQRLVGWTVLATLLLAIILVMSLHRIRDHLRLESPGSVSPPPAQPVPAPVRGAPEGPTRPR
jgi:hypothetical protein